MLRLTFIVLLTHCEYDLIILDEPSFGLGWKQKVILRQYLIEKMNYKHFIMISHDRLFLEAVSDKILDIDIEQLTTTFKQNEQEETA
jgi:ATPase subunit of ABC transporter with duplicated ATPase domains